MNYAQLYWNNGENKIIKTNRNEKNNILEKEIERKTNSLLDVNDSFPRNKEISVNSNNFRESIEINLESRNNNRDIIEKRLNKREKLKNGWFNPYLSTNKYIDDLTNENKFLRPRNTYKDNKKMDNDEI
jgi:hypothetical protein